jgi:protoporphyrinogen oxidase
MENDIMNKRIIILGGGISGLSAAWKLSESGIQVDVLEASAKIGGLAASVRKDSYCLDFGPHSFFSDDIEIVDIVLKLFDNSLKPASRQVKFYYKGKYINYPLTPYSVLFQMGVISGMKVALGFLKSKIVPHKRRVVEGEDETVEDWAISSFGENLYRTFFKPYTEQFWKVPCTELSSRSIPTHTRMSFADTCRMLLLRRFNKTDPSLVEREMLPTYYPKTGFGEIAERIAQAVTVAGSNVHLDCKATEINRLADGAVQVTYEQAGQSRQIEASHVISTIPLNLLVKMLKPSAPSEVIHSTEKLDYRALVILGLVTEKQDVLKCDYIYTLDHPYNRLSEMNNFNPDTSPSGDNIIAVEFPCLRESDIWSATKEELFERCIGSLTEDGFLTRKDVKRLFVIRAPYAYPVYHKDYAGHLERLLNHVDKYDGLTTLGRAGGFMYMDVDKCMRKAFDCAGKLLMKHQTNHEKKL